MKLSIIYDRLPIYYENRGCHIFYSPPGRGKTTIISEAPKRIGALLKKKMGFVHLNGESLNIMDLLGFGFPRHHETRPSIMVFSRPFFWTTDEGKYLEEYEGGIILVDEYDKIRDSDVKMMLVEFAHTGRIGQHRLPKDWVIWFAGNRAEDRSGSSRDYDHAINRQQRHDVTDDPAGWEDWATKNEVTPSTIMFARKNPHVVWSQKLPDVQGPFCTPRSTCTWDNHLKVVVKRAGGNIRDIPFDDILLEECAGNIGSEAAHHYFNTLRINLETPRYENVVADPAGCMVPEATDAQMLMVYEMAGRVSDKDAAAVLKYMDRLPKDMSGSFAKAATQRDFKLMKNAAFNRWCLSNSGVMQLLSGNSFK